MSIKSYRKEKLKETKLFGRKLRGRNNKIVVSKQASTYADADIPKLLLRGNELGSRWQVQLAEQKQSQVRAVQGISLVPRAVVDELSRLITQGHVGNKQIYSFLKDIAQNKKAQFLPFSTSLIDKELGFVGRCEDGRWLIVEPVRALEVPVADKTPDGFKKKKSLMNSEDLGSMSYSRCVFYR